MKKIVFILLILVILNDFALGAGIKETWESIKNFYTKAKKWLQDQGLWDPLVQALKDGARDLALRTCKNKCADPTICNDIVNWVYNHLP